MSPSPTIPPGAFTVTGPPLVPASSTAPQDAEDVPQDLARSMAASPPPLVPSSSTPPPDADAENQLDPAGAAESLPASPPPQVPQGDTAPDPQTPT